jgi:glycyl-radical enzyme activating protein
MQTVLADCGFYLRSGGGVTLSGGEPLAQPHFAAALLTACKSAGLHTALDTCGQVGWETFEQVLPSVDLVLYDLKHMDSSRHRACTGSGNEQILTNLRRLSQKGIPIELRMPIIPTANDDDTAIDAAGAFLASLPSAPPVRLLPYHALADGKHRRLGLDSPPTVNSPGADRMRSIADRLRSFGVQVVA